MKIVKNILFSLLLILTLAPAALLFHIVYIDYVVNEQFSYLGEANADLLGYRGENLITQKDAPQSLNFYMGADYRDDRYLQFKHFFESGNEEDFIIEYSCPTWITIDPDTFDEDSISLSKFHGKHLWYMYEYHMEDLPFHYTVKLTPTEHLEPGDYGDIHFGFRLYRSDDAILQMEQWEEQYGEDIYWSGWACLTYYYDGENVYWNQAIKTAE